MPEFTTTTTTPTPVIPDETGLGNPSSLQLGASSVPRGGTLSVNGSGFGAGVEVTLTMFSAPVELGRVTTDASGRFATSVRIPEDATPGTHRMVATWTDVDGRSYSRSASFRVTDSVVDPLARTGSDLPTSGLAAGAGMVVAATVLLYLRRRTHVLAPVPVRTGRR